MERSGLRDTTLREEERYFEHLRSMTYAQRGELMTAITFAVQDLAMASMRLDYPNATDRELWLRLAAKRLGNDVVGRIWGWSLDHN